MILDPKPSRTGISRRHITQGLAAGAAALAAPAVLRAQTGPVRIGYAMRAPAPGRPARRPARNPTTCSGPSS